VPYFGAALCRPLASPPSGAGRHFAEVSVISAIAAFQSDIKSEYYNPRELEVLHNQSKCGYRIRRDGLGTTPAGYPRSLCGQCAGLNRRYGAIT
jgi:hypothetical protein